MGHPKGVQENRVIGMEVPFEWGLLPVMWTETARCCPPSLYVIRLTNSADSKHKHMSTPRDKIRQEVAELLNMSQQNTFLALERLILKLDCLADGDGEDIDPDAAEALIHDLWLMTHDTTTGRQR